MKVYFDDIIFNLQKAGGISKYWSKLSSNIRSADLVNLQGKGAEQNVFYSNGQKTIINDYPLPLSIRRYLPVLKYIDCDIFHSSYYRTPLLINKKAKQVVTVHDFMYEFFDSGLKKDIHIWQKKRAMLRADAIICVSEHTKKDLIKLYPEVNKNILYVVPNGADEEFLSLPKKLNFITINDTILYKNQFLLYVGNRMGCKNFEFIFQLLSESNYIKDKKLKLVCVGGGKFSDEEISRFKKLNYMDNAFNVNNIDNKKLNDFYNSAYVLLFPSTYEGFGIPALEAQKAGCPVIYAKTSSLPEVIVYEELGFELDNISEAEEKLVLLNNNEFKKNIIEQGIEHATKLSWENSAEMTMNIYKKLLKI